MQTMYQRLKTAVMASLPTAGDVLYFDDASEQIVLRDGGANRISVTVQAEGSDDLRVRLGDAISFTILGGSADDFNEVHTILQAAIDGGLQEETWHRGDELVATRLTSPHAQWVEATDAAIMDDPDAQREVHTYQAY